MRGGGSNDEYYDYNAWDEDTYDFNPRGSGLPLTEGRGWYEEYYGDDDADEGEEEE